MGQNHNANFCDFAKSLLRGAWATKLQPYVGGTHTYYHQKSKERGSLQWRVVKITSEMSDSLAGWPIQNVHLFCVFAKSLLRGAWATKLQPYVGGTHTYYHQNFKGRGSPQWRVVKSVNQKNCVKHHFFKPWHLDRLQVKVFWHSLKELLFFITYLGVVLACEKCFFCPAPPFPPLLLRSFWKIEKNSSKWHLRVGQIFF